MLKFNFIKTLTAGVALATAFYPQAWAYSWATKTCEDPNGYACYDCGSDCTATLYQDGRLVVEGTGHVVSDGGSGTNGTFSNSEIKPTSLIIKEGITHANTNSFYGISTITSLELPNSLISVGDDGFAFFGQGISKIIMGENNMTIGGYGGVGLRNVNLASDVEIICRGDIEKCKAGKSGLFNVSGINYEIFSEIYDESGNLVAKYDEEGNMITGKQTRADGSIETLKDGELVGLKKTSPFTPAEAAALVKKGNHNTVTLTFK